ncbi:rod shape-determining protein MreC [Romeria aff. gracilis LEGE 07310]|uniref:Cell shape-determining protein MreC n=1 Tax=Vasconcelosia minhoensis LEGE 07310 TaxID=915328 RepID=A0A8J7AAP2_9CYAN|nr:rod shape-determining protein MreC [Romeria gracilis]MBE9079300.1 rod shape-determining protein MreC [Romeria aff. gracilis LEGE 07310]
MFALRRWWEKHALKAGLAGLAVGAAWLMHQANGAIVYETYQFLTRPLQPGLPTDEQIENAYVLELQERVVELENQNQRLRELVNYAEQQTRPSTMAAVIGRSADHWWQQVLLNRGSRDQIGEGDIVTGPGGLVGRVLAVTSNSARVLLISDPTSQIGAKVSRSRSMGVVRGQSSSQVTMEFFDKVPDVKPGDVIVTSSYSQLFPPDIPIGRVASIDLGKSPAPAAVIQLSAPLNILEWATVHPFTPKLDVNAPPANILKDDAEDSQ